MAAATHYCTVSDLFAYGLTPGALPNPARQVYATSADTDSFTLNDHGLATGDVVTFRVDAAGGILPAPIAPDTEYFAIRESDQRFAVSTAPGGAALNLTTAGQRILVATVIRYDDAIEWASTIIDDCLPAHVVPIDEAQIPTIVRVTCAELAAGKLCAKHGAVSATAKLTVDEAQKRMQRWAKNVPLRGIVTPPRAQIAVSAVGYRDLRGWRTDGTI